MNADILAHEFQGLLYIMTASLLFLLVTPVLPFAGTGRKLLFLGVLLALGAAYFGFEDIDPFIYGVHIIPVCMALAVLYEGAFAAAGTWLMFVLFSLGPVGTPWLPAAAAAALLAAAGALLQRFGRPADTPLARILRFLLIVTAYYAVFLPVFDLSGYSRSDVLLAVAGSYLSSVIVCIVYDQVKHQERMREELANVEKYQMVGQLAASISHEIRNPLTTSLGFLQLMHPNLTEEQFNRYRKHAIDGIESANAIITDYLNYAKPTVEEAHPLDIAAEVDGMVPWIGPLAVMNGIELDIRHEAQAPVYMMGESRKLQQCMLNVIKNAIEAMPGGGTLTVQTGAEGNQAVIRIRDTGVGMTEDQVRRIGMPFYSTKDKGTGLGLMVVTSVIGAMRGEMKFSSKPGQGTTCTLRFPAVPYPDRNS